MADVIQGEVLSFDAVKGYGFIAPDDDGPDVFLHVNDIVGDRAQVRPGVIVEYVPEEGAKGPKAAQVRALGDDLDVRRPAGRPVDRPDGEVDVLSPREFEDAITEMLLRAEPTLTGSQILHLRGRLGTMARGYGWVED
ncbi:cold-shock protein [Arsenicicoccus bolidensis]|uniref:cold-shock protein n=1 Tax=Arsenicicoccus bolidensis TaxID=229480 RepID=UPI0028AE15E0|nr:cold shock domain-containing protein [Arsenicicoccus bolidensis]